MLLISEAINQILGTSYFTELDIRKAYHWLWIASGGQWKTTFCTCYGHYEYIIVLFDLFNALTAFKGHINNMLRRHLDQFCITYLDDIIVCMNLLEEHREHI